MAILEAFARETFNVWLHVGMAQAACPQSQAWELCHDFEHLLCIDEEPSLKKWMISDQYENDRISSLRGVIPNKTFLKETLNLREPSLKWILEVELVEIVFHALQGVSSAVEHLEMLALSCSSWSIHRHDISLWGRTGSTRALDKILREFAYAGRIRCQLEEFMFSYSAAIDQHGNAQIPERRVDNEACKENRRTSRANLCCRKIQKHSYINSSSNKELGGAGLIGQAYIAALKSILLGHLVSNNTLAASTANGRQEIPESHEFNKQAEGPLLSFVSQQISLLELYLQTSELRIQLEALAAICLLNISSNGSIQNDKSDSGKGIDSNPVCVSTSDYKMAASNPSKFPKGAQLLSYLYSLLLEPNPLHMELLRFLFARTWQPYALFIHSWLFRATVTDPFSEFIVEKPENRIREVKHLPSFLAQACTELVRAGQQLEVLLRLPETRSFAQQLGTLVCVEDSLSSIHAKSAKSCVERSNALLLFGTMLMPMLVFSKDNIEKLEVRRAKRCENMRSQFDILFKDLVKAMKMEKDLIKNWKPLLEGQVIDRTNQSEGAAAMASPKSKQDSKSEGSGAILDFYWKEMECKSHTASQQCFYFDVESDQVLGLKTISTPKLQDQKDNRCIVLEAGSNQNLNCLEKSEAGASSNVHDIDQEDLARKDESSICIEFRNGMEDSCSISGNQRHSSLDTVCSSGSHTAMPTCKVIDNTCKHEEQGAFQLSKLEVPASIKESFILDYCQRTNWPKLGLPKNPFLEEEFHMLTSHPYACTYFTDTEIHWDLSSDPLSAVVLASLGTKLSICNPNYSKSVRQGQNVSIQPVSQGFSFNLANLQKN